MQSMPDENEQLKRVRQEAEAAEGKLRQMKERLIPRDRAEALRELLDAELRATVARETARFAPAIVAASTENEVQDVLQQMSAAMIAGAERVQSEIFSQMRSWTLAGLEDQAKEDDDEP